MSLRGLNRSCLLFLAALALAVMPATTRAQDSAAGDLVLKDDFEIGRFDPKGGLFYKNNAEQLSGRVTFQNRNVHSGRGAVTLAVTPSC